jgi:hypothetical protein
MSKRDVTRTASGTPVTDELVARLAMNAEAGYDAEEILRRRGGKPMMVQADARIESVVLDEELHRALAARAARDHKTTSAAIRDALRAYLKAG